VPRDWLNAFSKQPLPFMEWMKTYLGFTIERTPFGYQRIISTEKCPGKERVRNSYWYMWMLSDFPSGTLVCPHCWAAVPGPQKKDYDRVFVRRGATCSQSRTAVLEVAPCLHTYPYEGPGSGLCQVCHVPVPKGKYCGVCAANVKLCPCGRKNRKKKKETQQ
jgi:hypothetical protein